MPELDGYQSWAQIRGLYLLLDYIDHHIYLVYLTTMHATTG